MVIVLWGKVQTSELTVTNGSANGGWASVNGA
jgi:hypothetical protein